MNPKTNREVIAVLESELNVWRMGWNRDQHIIACLKRAIAIVRAWHADITPADVRAAERNRKGLMFSANPTVRELLDRYGASVRLYNILNPRFGWHELNSMQKYWPEERLRRELPGYGWQTSRERNAIVRASRKGRAK